MPNPSEYRKKIDAAAQKRGLNEKQIKALYVLNGVESKSGTATETSYRNTSPERIRYAFGSGSKIAKLSDAEINELKKDDKKFFDFVYGEKLGNNGEGYKYRGRGGVQLTGKSNYEKLTKLLNKNGVDIDLVANPDLAADPRYSADILVAFADKEGMFTEGSKKYLSDSDLDKIAQGDMGAIDKLHNITNSEAPNDHMAKIAKEVYANKDGAYDVSNMTDAGKGGSGGDNLSVVTKDGKDYIVTPDGKAYESKGGGGITEDDMEYIIAQMDSSELAESNKYQVSEGVSGADLIKELQDPNSGTAPNSRWLEGTTKRDGNKVPTWLKDSYEKVAGAATDGSEGNQVPSWLKDSYENVSDAFKEGAGIKDKGLGDAAKKGMIRGTGIGDGTVVDKTDGDIANMGDDEIVIENIPNKDEAAIKGSVEGESADDIRRRIEDNKALLDDVTGRAKFVHDYAPDKESGTDLGGYITDAARGIMGTIGASEKIPVYERGKMFQTSMDELTQRRNMGLTDTEKDFARQMAERGYGYDVKNIGKFAGGSAGVALGNLGRATSQLQDQYGQIVVRDEAVRRQNRADFNRGALSDEQVNRQIFEDDLNQKMMTKQAGAALVQDSIKNIKDRAQYERAYGKGSQMYEYMKTLDKDMQKSMSDQERAEADRVAEMKKTTERAIEDDEKLLQSRGLLTNGTVLGGSPGSKIFKQTAPFVQKRTVAELQQMKANNEIDEEAYQIELSKLDEEMPDDFVFPTAATNATPLVQTVRGTSYSE